MAETISIPKCNEAHDNYPCWVETVNSKSEHVKPSIICKCGNYCGIRNHHIHADGRVTASFFHRNPPDPKGCGWHVFLTLEDYDCGEFKPGQ